MQGLRSVRSEVDRACELLASPSPGALDGCSRALEAAGCQLAECQPLLREGTLGDGIRSREAFEEARRLQADVRRAGQLLDGAFNFHLNWSRWLGAMSAGYTQQGDPAPVSRGNRMSIKV